MLSSPSVYNPSCDSSDLSSSGSLDTIYRIIQKSKSGVFNPFDFEQQRSFKENGLHLYNLTDDPYADKRNTKREHTVFIKEFEASAYLNFLKSEEKDRIQKIASFNNSLKDLGLLSDRYKVPINDHIQFNLDQVDNAITSLQSYIDKTALEYIVSSFRGHLRAWEHKRYIVAQKEDKTRFIELGNRFSEKRQHQLKKRMKYLIASRGNQNAVMLTLTLNPQLFKSQSEMWLTIKPELNRFLTSLRYNLKHRLPEYLTTIEAQKNGNPHIHIVFFGAKRLLDWRKIRDLWGLGHIFINRTSDCSKVRYPINYVCKYITKTYTTSDEHNLLTQSLVWFYNVRSYSCSRGLLYPLNLISLGGWCVDWLIVCTSYIVPQNDEGGGYG